MEEKKSTTINVSTIFLVLAIIVIVIMGYIIYKLYNDKIETNAKVEKLNNEISSLGKTIANLQETIDNNSKNNISSDSNTADNNSNTNSTSNSNTMNTTENNEDIIGTWKTYQAHNAQTAETIVDLTKIFGTSYITYGSYLKLNEDGTFLDAIYPITSGEYSIEGTYTIEKNYYKEGDCYVFLNYSDGRTKTFMRIYYEENVPVLSCFDAGDTYQFDLKK